MRAVPTAAVSRRTKLHLHTERPFWCGITLALLLGTSAIVAQSPSSDQAETKDKDVQQLEDQVRHLEQVTQELKARIAAMERVGNNAAAAATSSSAAQSPTVPNGTSGYEGQVLPISLSTTTASVQ